MGTSLCVAVVNHKVLTSSDPTGGAGAWHTTNIYPYEVTRQGDFSDTLTCVPGLCLIAGSDGYLIGASNPLAGLSAWVGTSIGDETGLDGVACVSRKLCIETGGIVIMGSAKAERAGARWRAYSNRLATEREHANFMSVACTPSGLCIAGGTAGTTSGVVTVDTNVARYPHSWHITRVGGSGIVAVTCPASNLCLASDQHGEVLVGS